MDYVRGVWAAQHANQLTQVQTATAYGSKSEVTKYTKAAGATSDQARVSGIWTEAPAYNAIIKQRDLVLNNPKASGPEKSRALQEAATSLYALSQTPGLDMRTAVTLENEAKANAGDTTQATQPTFGEDYLGTRTHGYEEGGSTVSPTGANATISTLSSQLYQEGVLVSTDPANYTYTYGKRDAKTGVFTPSPDGKDVGVAANSAITSTATHYAVFAVPQAGGPPIFMTVVGKPITTVCNDVNGNPIDAGVSDGAGGVTKLVNPVIGYAFDVNGKTVSQLTDKNGKIFYTLDPGYATGNQVTVKSDGSIVVDVSRTVTTTNATLTDINDTTGKTTTYYNPTAAAVSPSRQIAGRNHTVDFDTPIMASVGAAPPDDTQGLSTFLFTNPVARWMITQQDPTFGTVDANGRAVDSEASDILSHAFAYGVGNAPIYDYPDSRPPASFATVPRGDNAPMPSESAGSFLGVRTSSGSVPGYTERAAGPGYVQGSQPVAGQVPIKVPFYGPAPTPQQGAAGPGFVQPNVVVPSLPGSMGTGTPSPTPTPVANRDAYWSTPTATPSPAPTPVAPAQVARNPRPI